MFVDILRGMEVSVGLCDLESALLNMHPPAILGVVRVKDHKCQDSKDGELCRRRAKLEGIRISVGCGKHSKGSVKDQMAQFNRP